MEGEQEQPISEDFEVIQSDEAQEAREYAEEHHLAAGHEADEPEIEMQEGDVDQEEEALQVMTQ